MDGVRHGVRSSGRCRDVYGGAKYMRVCLSVKLDGVDLRVQNICDFLLLYGTRRCVLLEAGSVCCHFVRKIAKSGGGYSVNLRALFSCLLPTKDGW